MGTKQSDTAEYVKSKKAARNEDPITGEPRAHPAAVGVGTAAGGAVAGAALGAVGGPIGAAVGAVAGGIAGGAAGKAMGERIDPTVEEAYWQDNYATRDYVAKGEPFETYRSAYRYGVECYANSSDRDFDDIEMELADGWNDPTLDWDRASPAVRDAYDRLRASRPRCS